MVLSLNDLCGLVLIVVAARGEYVLRGEYGQAVAGCACIGKTNTHGYCGFHKNVFSSGDKPWCRTKHGCGHSSLRGSWDECDERSIERRFDEGRWRTARDFSDTYGKAGKEKYIAAAKEQRKAGGQWYTIHEFHDYYVDTEGEKGWLQKWLGAEIRPRRQANDGKWYTWEEFEEFYRDSANDRWKNAKSEL
mmetsp:Transcript_68603/g.108841  ORF Transcript_68603/g.108841 Transcript_68603/m.108841 type:complete len:191 (-) Transcript_68603:83-655(-)